MSRVAISVVTPTYNRAKLIERVFLSLMNQSFTDFEWVVVDDGSTDETEFVIKKYMQASFFKIKYIKTENQGKAMALNDSVKYCDGELYLVFDSDDWCDPDALLIFNEEWNKLSNKQKKDYAAISCLKRDMNGACVGDTYSGIDKYGLTYIDRVNHGVKGDKWECLVLDKISSLKYPVVKNDKYMAPDYIWLKVAGKGYKTVFLNKSLSTIEYQEDGISRNNILHRVGSARTTYKYYLDVSQVKGLSFKAAVRMKINKHRFSLHSGRGVLGFNLLNPLFNIGLVLFFIDYFSLKGCRG